MYCGVGSADAALEVDHVVPVSRGGTDDADNLIAACFDCNRGKSARVRPSDFVAWLRGQRGRDDLVGDLADDEERTPLPPIESFPALLRALRAAIGRSRLHDKVAGAAYHAWQEFRRGRPTRVTREMHEELARAKAGAGGNACVWSKDGLYVGGVRYAFDEGRA